MTADQPIAALVASVRGVDRLDPRPVGTGIRYRSDPDELGDYLTTVPEPRTSPEVVEDVCALCGQAGASSRSSAGVPLHCLDDEPPPRRVVLSPRLQADCFTAWNVYGVRPSNLDRHAPSPDWSRVSRFGSDRPEGTPEGRVGEREGT